MPLSKYFKGDGPEVMASMQKRYGAEEGKRVFYATANARGMAPKKRKHGRGSVLAELNRRGKK